MANKKHIYIIITIICIFLFGFIYINLSNKNDIEILTADKNQSQDLNTKDSNTKDTKIEENLVTPTPTEKNIDIEIVSYISGEVKTPDVYTLKSGSRIKDLVEMAGGFTENADKININLAKIINDEEHIHIYAIGDEIKLEISEKSSSENNKTNLININKATKEQLMTLPSIGDVISDSIISYREENGGFKEIEEIKNVSRVGDSVFNKIKDLISLN